MAYQRAQFSMTLGDLQNSHSLIATLQVFSNAIICTIVQHLTTVFPRIEAGPWIQAGSRIQTGGRGLYTDRLWQVCTARH